MHQISRSIRAGVVAVILGVTVTLLPPPASATHLEGLLCSGYAGCAREGRGSAGYAGANKKMYWQMYSGHNCTNYVAYRMARKGITKRPWSGYGNAMHWGRYLKGRTDSTPRVGAIAWWTSNTSRSGSSGHVGYVENVLSPSAIIVSQDSWGGDFSWVKVTRSTGWPTGFIHLADTSLRNQERPSVSGVARVGERLHARRGQWEPRPSISYRWRVGGARVDGARGDSLALTRRMIGKPVRVEAIATRYGYPRSVVSSEPAGTVLPGLFRASRLPDLSGRARVNEHLRVSAGSWSPRPRKISYQWLADGDPLRGATSRRLRLGPGRVGDSVAVQVTVKRRGYEPATRTIRANREIRPDRLRLRGGPVLRGNPRAGDTLTLRSKQSRPRAARSVRWLRDGKVIAREHKGTYRLTGADLGARVRAEVTYRKPGYRTVVLNTIGTRAVKAVPRVRVSTDRLKRGVRITVSARAGGAPLSAPVVAIRGGKQVDRGVTRKGTSTLRLTRIPRGRSQVRLVVGATERTFRVEVVRRLRR